MTGGIVEGLEHLGRFVDFAFRTVGAMPGALVRRAGDIIRQFERVAWGSLPIIVVAGISVGLVTWLQTHRQLATYGIEATLPSFLTPAVLVELGPMLAGLLVAGRMGAGLAAELGSMMLTEEVEARAVLGALPIPTLVAPRAIACALAVPLLTVVLDAAAVLGGMGAELMGGTLTASVFWHKSLLYLRISDVLPATLKTSVFGLLIGLVGCWTGLNADRSTESVGRAATTGVVRAMFAVFVANVALVPWIQAMTILTEWTN
ncbi:phospholipid/cholesterol/gamma-HCH transport system permease protein [Singulisphaera sp. GP187]|nr:phospholipid/cholesterol/gamma-HCH transport system permease protein [Singulisphaera sp. GP187]